MGEAAAIHAVRFARPDARGRFFQKWRMTSRRRIGDFADLSVEGALAR